MRFLILAYILCGLSVSGYPHREEEEARVLSEVWEAMDRNKGDEIIVIPRRDEGEPEKPRDENKSESEHNGDGHSESESTVDKVWGKINDFGDSIKGAVNRFRKDGKEVDESANGAASGGLTMFILEIVGAVVVGLVVVVLLILGLVKGVNKIRVWKARRESERLVDQDAPNMDGTGYQSGYNP